VPSCEAFAVLCVARLHGSKPVDQRTQAAPRGISGGVDNHANRRREVRREGCRECDEGFDSACGSADYDNTPLPLMVMAPFYEALRATSGKQLHIRHGDVEGWPGFGR
jgi:hypothetical protein